MSDTSQKWAFFKKNVDDAGTAKGDAEPGVARRYSKGAVVKLDAGHFGNFEAAGSIRAASEDEVRAAEQAEVSAAKSSSPQADAKPSGSGAADTKPAGSAVSDGKPGTQAPAT